MLGYITSFIHKQGHWPPSNQLRHTNHKPEPDAVLQKQQVAWRRDAVASPSSSWELGGCSINHKLVLTCHSQPCQSADVSARPATFLSVTATSNLTCGYASSAANEGNFSSSHAAARLLVPASELLS
jgi:hypothetical protein